MARPTGRLSAASPKPETITQVLVAGTVALCCVAPLLTSLSRSGQAPREAYLIFERLFFFNDYAGSLAMLVALVVALALPKVQQAVIGLATWVGEHPGATIAAAFVTLAACSRFVYMAHPLSMDEYAPWMQAHAFAQGHLAAHYPPQLLDAIVPKEFQGYFIGVNHSTGEAASKYWPGLALMLAPFVWLDLGWCLNPAFGALALAMIYKLASEATGQRVAGGWAMLAALASPQFTVNAISLYAMPGELALNLLFLWLLLRPSAKSAFAAGLVGGLALAMHNPVPHALMAAPALVWLAWDRQRWPWLAAALAGYVPPAAILLLGWVSYLSGVEAAVARTGAPAAHHGLLDVVSYFFGSVLMVPTDDMVLARWYATWKVWIWGCPGLLFVLFIPRSKGIAERLLLAAFATTFLFFLFVRFDQGHGWGYRYIHTAWAALPVAAGIWLATARDASRKWGATMIAAGLLATPVFMWQTHQTIAETLSWRLSPPATGEWVVFVAEDTGRYRGDLVQNASDRTGRLHLVSRGEAEDNALMARQFPGAVRLERDRRGSLWRLPEGMLAEKLRAMSVRAAGAR
ncbi:hypothetical protein [Ramlibacter sp.]|uniref:hypothetical protein n=1 Tax=Ramlibacter sp. TaxID=1917967 RepID=UPI002608277A|nr:hypothetical protein [Ramlibacter sp.]